MEGIQAGEHLLELVSRETLLGILDSEITICQRLNQTEARLLFQKEKDF